MKPIVESGFSVREIAGKEQMLKQYALLIQLNKNLNYQAVDYMLDDMLAHDYHMAGVFQGEDCIGLSGYWISTKLYCGRYLEMDNVVIDENYRSKGIGKLLCDYLEQKAIESRCGMIMLDAYLENEAAHRFYEREGFTKRGYHFLKTIA